MGLDKTFTEKTYIAESMRLLREAVDYAQRGMLEGAAWRMADSLYWLNQAGYVDTAGIDKPTGLGNMLTNTSIERT